MSSSLGRFAKTLFLTYLIGMCCDIRGMDLGVLTQIGRLDLVVDQSLTSFLADNCRFKCREKHFLNAVRASILLGDLSGASRILSTQRLVFVDARSNVEFERKINFMRFYVFLLMKNKNESKNVLSLFSETDQKRLAQLVFLDASNEFDSIVTVDNQVIKEEFLREYRSNDYDFLQKKNPYLAGGISLVIPGLGFGYLGMWQSAALSFLLTGVCVGSAWELRQANANWSAGGAALLGSLFYIGGALGAARSANDINEKFAQPRKSAIRYQIFPELKLEF